MHRSDDRHGIAGTPNVNRDDPASPAPKGPPYGTGPGRTSSYTHRRSPLPSAGPVLPVASPVTANRR